MDLEKFEELVIRALEGLPEEFRERLENVQVVVEAAPSSRQMRRMRLKSPLQLLGLYEGIPLTERGSTNYNLVMPDKVTIFQKSVESVCSSNEQIETEIREVVKHEIAHHFGISDATLIQIEKGKAKKSRKSS
jgi:predicted Zn-dependent protease with MMP-like domain